MNLPVNNVRRLLTEEERECLKEQGCRASCWDTVTVTDDTDLSLLRNVRFSGEVSIGSLCASSERDEGIENVAIRDCFIGNNVSIRNVGGRILGAHIGDRVIIENVARIEFEPEAMCGLLTQVSVLDETGSRQVPIYPGLSAQVAHLACHYPRWTQERLMPMLEDKFGFAGTKPFIGDDAIIRDCGPLINVAVGREVNIEGASSLKNGMIINNAAPGRPFARIGTGVDAEDFIIEDGFVGAGSLLRHCYVGQGAIIDKGFTAHDTLAFANVSLENGEACALFAGPYTVSMHKASLLIGCQLSFMNAGSATNQSNHMYKLGPVHFGVMERGAKTASSSYIMWGAKIGAFSLVMGVHKNHPDASQFPFSYLFGDEKGATTVVPGMMLRSCGLQRDEMKWPTRDRRRKRRLPKHDRINFEVLNPVTVSRMLDSLELIDELLQRGGDDDLFIRYKGMKFRSSSLDRAKQYYRLAIGSYFHKLLGENDFPPAFTSDAPIKWHDIAGQIITDDTLRKALESESINELEEVLTQAQDSFEADQLRWIAEAAPARFRERRAMLPEMHDEFMQMIEEDRQSYRRTLAEENAMLTTHLPEGFSF